MQTLRRELRQKFEKVITDNRIFPYDKAESDAIRELRVFRLSELLADAALEVRGIALAKPTARIDRTDAEQAELDEKKMTDIIGATQEGGKAISACVAFERVFGFGTLPWGSNTTWEKFAKFVRAVHEKDTAAFGNYVVWRAGAGKYNGYSNKKIRENPQAFMDTGWPEFESCKTSEINSKKQDEWL